MRCWSVPCRAAAESFRGAACTNGASTTAAAVVRRRRPPVVCCGGPLEVPGQDEPRARKQRLDRLGVHLRRRAAVGSSALPSRTLPAASGALHVLSCSLQALRRMLQVASCNLGVARCTLHVVSRLLHVACRKLHVAWRAMRLRRFSAAVCAAASWPAVCDMADAGRAVHAPCLAPSTLHATMDARAMQAPCVRMPALRPD